MTLRWSRRSPAAGGTASAQPARNRQPSPAPAGRDAERSGRQSCFTLIELLAVVVIIILLAGLVAGLGVYSQRKAKVARAQAEIGLLQGLIEGYRSDQGAYPTSTTVRVSLLWVYEALNSMLLLEQLDAGGYASPVMDMVHTMSIGTNLQERGEIYLFQSCGVTNLYAVQALFDPWMTPYNYYCTYPRQPTTSVADFPNLGYPCYSTDVVSGGQKNLLSFDLWSYGPDRLSCAFAAGASYINNPEMAIDDIANFP